MWPFDRASRLEGEAVFKQTVLGFQANAFNGLNFSLINAGQESARGVEAEGAYAPVRWLTFTGAVTYLDPRFDSFTGAPCVAFDTVRCAPDPVTGRLPPYRDLSGEKPAGIPSWSGSATATITHDFGKSWRGFVRGEYQYIGKAPLTDVPGNLSSYGANVVNASVSLSNDAAKLGAMLWVRNLTKDTYPTAVFPATLQAGSYSIFPNQPRTYGITLSKAF